MSDSVAMFVSGLIVLGIGTELFSRAMLWIVRSVGTGRSVEAVIVAAASYAAPVLAVSLAIALSHYPRTALATVVGANITNVGLVLGVAALLRPVTGQSRILPGGIVILLATSLFVWFLARDNELSRIDAILLLIAFAFVVAGTMRFGRRESVTAKHATIAIPGLGLLAFAVLISGVAGLLVGAALIARSLAGFNSETGAGGVTVALTAIVPGITVRSLAAAVIATRRGQADTILGGVIGGSIINLLLTLGVIAAASPVPVAPALLMNELPVMVIFAAFLLPALATGLKVHRWEGAMLLTAYTAFIAWEARGGGR